MGNEMELAKFRANVFLTLGAVIAGVGFSILYDKTELNTWDDLRNIFSLDPESPLVTNGFDLVVIGAFFIFGTYFWMRRRLQDEKTKKKDAEDET